MPYIAPTTVSTGDIYEATAHNVIVGDIIDHEARLVDLAPLFAAWTSWTPTIDQGATTNIAKTVTSSGYVRIGKLVIWNLAMTINGAGTAGASLVISYPANIQPKNTSTHIGNAYLNDSSTSTSYNSFLLPSGVAGQRFALLGDWSGASVWGVTPNLAVANGDVFVAGGTYETA